MQTAPVLRQRQRTFQRIIRHAILTLIMLMVALFTLPGCAQEPDSDEPLALQMVHRLKLGANFTHIASLAAQQTRTYRMLEASTSPTAAKSILDKQLEQVLPKYQAEWDRNLADAYSEVFTEEEMASLIRKGRRSPHAQKLVISAQEVGLGMQRRSSGLLTRAVTEALTSAMARRDQ